MGKIVTQLKAGAVPYAVFTVAALYFGLIGPGASTPDFLKPAPATAV